jgi:hypothetical protein
MPFWWSEPNDIQVDYSSQHRSNRITTLANVLRDEASAPALNEDINDRLDVLSSPELFPALSLMDRIIVLLAACLLTGSYVLAFSQVVGYGGETFKTLRRDQYENEMLIVAIAITVVLYVADVSFWTGRMAVAIRKVLFGCVAILSAMALGLSAYRYPQAPPTLYLVLTPLICIKLRSLCFSSKSVSSYLSSLAMSLYGCAGVILLIFLSEASRTNAWWSTALEVRYRESIGCNLDLDTECLAAYIMWFSPCLAALASVIFATFCALMSKSLQSNDKNDILGFAYKAFGCGMMFVFLGLWVAVSIAGGAKPLSSILVTFSMAALLVLSGALVATLGLDSLHSRVSSVPLFASLMSAVTETYANAFKAVLISTPLTFVFLIYLLMSMVNQRVRRIFNTAPSVEHKSHVFTTKVTEQLAELRKWNWSRIMINLHYWVILVIALQVVAGSFTVVFLSYLRVKLAAIPVHLVYIIFSLVGLAMFLIPIIPGLPVYLTGGIILTDTPMSEAFGGGTHGYIWSCAVAVVVCFGIKLIAVVMQQKGIGEQLGNRVWIRSMVNVNSVTMRSIRYLLTRKGLNMPKVAILVGGPDWPTSVITGILGLRVSEMIIGTLPVFFLITPTTLAGAFMLKASRSASATASALCRETLASALVNDDSSPWNSIADIGLILTGFVQGLGLIAAAYYIEKTSAEAGDELAAMPYDEEVMEVDKAEERRNELTRAIMHWSELSTATRRTLVFSTLVCACAFWGIMFGPFVAGEEAIVRDYLLTDCISTRLGGKAWRIMTEVGWFLLAAVVFAWFVVSRITANARTDVDAIVAEEKHFADMLNGTPKRAWAECPNVDEAVDEENFKIRFATMLETLSEAQVREVERTMTERTLAPFSQETSEWIRATLAEALSQYPPPTSQK